MNTTFIIESLTNIEPLASHQVTFYSAVISMALIPIYFGSFMSTTRVKDMEKLKTSDALKYPIVGSVVLLGLFFLFKFLNKDLVNLLLNIYIFVGSAAALMATIRSFLEVPLNMIGVKTDKLPSFDVKIPYLFEGKVDVLDIICLLIGMALHITYLFTKYWILNNVIAFAFCIQAIALVSVGHISNGALLLGLLFFYDIFWVFFTPVMVTVAKSFDGPIKLLFPKDLFAETYTFGLLGLGDIVLPGFYLAFLLRFDLHRIAQGLTTKPVYFSVTFVCYTLGLATTMAVMHIFKAAQPALLYLVPACFIGTLLGMIFTADFKGLWAYNESSDEAAKDEKADDKQKQE